MWSRALLSRSHWLISAVIALLFSLEMAFKMSRWREMRYEREQHRELNFKRETAGRAGSEVFDRIADVLSSYILLLGTLHGSWMDILSFH